MVIEAGWHGHRESVRAVARAVILCCLLMAQPSCGLTSTSSSGATFEQLGLTGGVWVSGNLGVLIASPDRRSAIFIEASRPDVVLRSEWREFDLERTDLVKVCYLECNKDIVTHHVSDALDATSEITKYVKADHGVVRIRVFGAQNEYGRPLASYTADIDLIDVRIDCAGHPAEPWVVTDSLRQVPIILVGSSDPDGHEEPSER